MVGAGDAHRRLDLFLTEKLPSLSRAEVQRLVRTGRVRVSGARAKASLGVAPGWTVEVDVPDPAPALPQPEALPLTILHDDADISVIDKPAGMVVHPAAGHQTGTLVNALLYRVGGLSGIGGVERPGIVHRLDRGTSGVMVIAKHDQAHRALARQFHDREVAKEYVALVWGTPSEGQQLDQPIGRDRRQRAKISSRTAHPKAALTTITRVEPLGGVSLVAVTIGTGRTHQIRVHLAESGHPVAGDATYGGVRARVPERLSAVAGLTRPFLHAARLSFMHPGSSERVTFDAPLPTELQLVLDDLRRRRKP